MCGRCVCTRPILLLYKYLKCLRYTSLVPTRPGNEARGTLAKVGSKFLNSCISTEDYNILHLNSVFNQVVVKPNCQHFLECCYNLRNFPCTCSWLNNMQNFTFHSEYFCRLSIMSYSCENTVMLQQLFAMCLYTLYSYLCVAAARETQ